MAIHRGIDRGSCESEVLAHKGLGRSFVLTLVLTEGFRQPEVDEVDSVRRTFGWVAENHVGWLQVPVSISYFVHRLQSVDSLKPYLEDCA